VTDPLERIKLLVEDAERERDTLRHQKSVADMEIHQLRRRLARTEDGYREANDLAEELKRQLAVVEQQAEQARRAMLDHAART
jgi:chromosome segregation ATPase